MFQLVVQRYRDFYLPAYRKKGEMAAAGAHSKRKPNKATKKDEKLEIARAAERKERQKLIDVYESTVLKTAREKKDPQAAARLSVCQSTRLCTCMLANHCCPRRQAFSTRYRHQLQTCANFPISWHSEV